MVKKGSKKEPRPWNTNFTGGLRVNFQNDPDVHTFLSILPDGEVNGAVKEAIRHLIKATNHIAGNPDFQREVAQKGMFSVINAVTGAAGTDVDEEAPVAPAAEGSSGDKSPAAAPAAGAKTKPAKPGIVSRFDD